MSPRLPDPGGIFDSDAHRRVLGHVTTHENPRKTRDTLETLTEHLRIDHETASDLGGARPELHDQEEVEEILKDLEANGYVSLKDGLVKRLKAGDDALSAPLPTEEEEGKE